MLKDKVMIQWWLKLKPILGLKGVLY